MSGSLAKAPRFDEVGGFDKSRNGLLPIHIHVDQRGFVWINLEAGEKPRTPWTDTFHGADTHPRLQAFDMDDYTFDHTWNMDGQYNWKTLVDNYNEVTYLRACLRAGLTVSLVLSLWDSASWHCRSLGPDDL